MKGKRRWGGRGWVGRKDEKTESKGGRKRKVVMVETKAYSPAPPNS